MDDSILLHITLLSFPTNDFACRQGVWFVVSCNNIVSHVGAAWSGSCKSKQGTRYNTTWRKTVENKNAMTRDALLNWLSVGGHLEIHSQVLDPSYLSEFANGTLGILGWPRCSKIQMWLNTSVQFCTYLYSSEDTDTIWYNKICSFEDTIRYVFLPQKSQTRNCKSKPHYAFVPRATCAAITAQQPCRAPDTRFLDNQRGKKC